jgi:hypothetical protein
VLVCVVLTLANVGGFMHFWGLTIDTVSCTNLIIAIGLCVDYSAHIAHAFLHAKGTRDAKVKTALTDIGPAVLNGGFSTFLAFILLAGSRSHVFQSFFKKRLAIIKTKKKPNDKQDGPSYEPRKCIIIFFKSNYRTNILPPMYLSINQSYALIFGTNFKA